VLRHRSPPWRIQLLGNTSPSDMKAADASLSFWARICSFSVSSTKLLEASQIAQDNFANYGKESWWRIFGYDFHLYIKNIF
jgi:hypothetical protein